MKASRLEAVKDHGGHWDIRLDCPECETTLHPTVRGDWGGRKISDEKCYGCGATVSFMGVVEEE